jgi:hypothetical protein
VESVENSKNKDEFPTLPTGLGNPAKNKAPDFHISHRAGRRAYIRRRKSQMALEQNSS